MIDFNNTRGINDFYCLSRASRADPYPRIDLRGEKRCMVRVSRSVWIWLVCVALSILAVDEASAEPAPLVFLNNVPAAVTFNDGDSFRVLEGPNTGSKARLAGFNTLESHGPVHQWGGWHYKELYALAKMATLNARRGVWHCESKDLAADGYGRILWYCLDLAEDQIRHGFAHAMTVSDEPANPRLLAAQHDAIRHRRGMWAKGVPTYVLTSIHSADEGFGKKTYNRLVNTVDGHSKRWYHNAIFSECQDVCHHPTELPMNEAYRVVSELRADAAVAPYVRGIDDILVALSVNTFIQNGFVPKIFGDNAKVQAALESMKSKGRFASVRSIKGACAIHVDFKRRYVRPKPACLQW